MAKHNTDRLPSVIRDSCGTFAGYNAHRKHGEVTCQSCRNSVAQVRALERAVDPEKTSRDRAIYRLENSEQIRIYFANFRVENREKRRLYKIAYRLANPDIYDEYRNKRRALKLGAPSEPYTAQKIINLYGSDCHICSEPIDLEVPRHVGDKGWERGLHLDHVIPLSRGGTDLIGNIRPSHGLCNMIKRNTLI